MEPLNTRHQLRAHETTRRKFPLAIRWCWLCCWLLLAIPAWAQARIVLAGSGSSIADLVTDGFRESMIDAKDADAYPLISFAWVYVPASGLAQERRAALLQFLIWSLGEGQVSLGDHDYYPLPRAIAMRAQATLQSVLR